MMTTQSGNHKVNPIFLQSDKIVRRLDNYPELTRALRTGDVRTGRLLCAQLFDTGTRGSSFEPKARK